MKKLVFLAVLVLICTNAFPQAVTELRPSWTRQVPQIPAGANYFVNWGVGEGRTESEATNMAWADALQKSLHELGVVGITAQDINAVATDGINAVVKFNRMKRRIVTSTEPIALSANRVKIRYRRLLLAEYRRLQRHIVRQEDEGLQCPAYRTLSFLGPRFCARHGTTAQRQYGKRTFLHHQ